MKISWLNYKQKIDSPIVWPTNNNECSFHCSKHGIFQGIILEQPPPPPRRKKDPAKIQIEKNFFQAQCMIQSSLFGTSNYCLKYAMDLKIDRIFKWHFIIISWQLSIKTWTAWSPLKVALCVCVCVCLFICYCCSAFTILIIK